MNEADNARIKQGIEATFDNVSDSYDEIRFFSISAKKMAEVIPPKENMKVLDLSTGTGIVAIEVSKRFPDAEIEAVDISSGMIKQARKKAESEGISNISFKKQDVEKLSYKDGMFDVVTCGYGLFFYPEMEKTYRMICRKIKPAGSFVFSTFTENAFTPYSDLFLHRIQNVYGVELPKLSRRRLSTREQIEGLASLSLPKKVEIEEYEIRYSINTNDWWSILYNAGFRGGPRPAG